MNRERCIKALDNLRCRQTVDYIKGDYHYYYMMINDYAEIFQCFEQLINEHFSASETRVESSLTRNNPPLELENYLKRIQELELKEKQWIETEKDYRDELKELKSNPPLKLDDLKKDMWIWYNDKYRKVYKVDKENNIVVLVETGYLKPIEYEENKFYRYEVHGNETKI